MFTKVSVLVPTRNRLGRLRRMLDSYAHTRVGDTSELVFRIDEDDHATRAALANQLHVVIGPRLQGYASMGTFFNEMYRASTGDVLLCGNDDMVFKTPGWAPLVLEAANRYPDGLFNFGVTTHNPTHYPFSIVSRMAADRLGFLWDPRIYWGDVYLRDVMASFGRAEYLPAVEIAHDWIGFEPDQTFREGNQNDIFRRDPGYWEGTHATAVADAVRVLQGLRQEVLA